MDTACDYSILVYYSFKKNIFQRSYTNLGKYVYKENRIISNTSDNVYFMLIKITIC